MLKILNYLVRCTLNECWRSQYEFAYVCMYVCMYVCLSVIPYSLDQTPLSISRRSQIVAS